MFNNELWQKPAGGAGGSGFYDYQIAKSFRWTDGAAYLKRTPSAAGNRQTWTFSCWMKASGVNVNTQGDVQILGAGSSGNQDTRFRMYFYNSQLYSSSNEANYNTSPGVYRDPSAWYHVVWKLTGGTSYQYVNGTLASTFSVSGNVAINNNVEHLLGILPNLETISKFKGYMAEVVFIDGTALDPTSFAESKNGVWIPKDPSTLTFGSQGYHLDFADASAPGNDVSGNNNDWTNISLATHDQTLDSPTFGNSSSGNFATLNPISQQAGSTADRKASLSDGNLFQAFTNATTGCIGTMGFNSTSGGKWYWEVAITNYLAGLMPGIVNDLQNLDAEFGYSSPSSPTGVDSCGYYIENGNVNPAGVGDGSGFTAYGSSVGAGDVMGIALDVDNGKIWFSKNGTFQNSGNPVTGANPARGAGGTITTAFDFSRNWFPAVANWSASSATGITYNFGQEGTFGGTKTAGGNADENGYGNFYYAPPTDFLALCAGNLPVADAIDPAQTDDDYPQELFFMSDYTGNLTNRTITTENQPDLIWNRQANNSQDWYVVDSTRGITANKYINTNTTGAEATLPQGNFTSVGATSVGISSGTWLNSTGANYKMWMWRVNGGSLTTNNVGTQTSYTQTDPSGAFSITKYVGTGSAMTVGHGLSVEPKITIIKDLDTVVSWPVYTKIIDGSMDYFFLDTGDAAGTSGLTGPNSSVWSWQSASGLSNTASKNYIMYNFANIEGYCKVGTYVGNANNDGTFVYTGFKPAFMMNKPIVAGSWRVVDSQRSPYNVTQNALSPNNSNAKDTYDSVNIDFLSNGFKMRNYDTPMNQATTFVYLAFAENPFKYATAR